MTYINVPRVRVDSTFNRDKIGLIDDDAGITVAQNVGMIGYMPYHLSDWELTVKVTHIVYEIVALYYMGLVLDPNAVISNELKEIGLELPMLSREEIDKILHIHVSNGAGCITYWINEMMYMSI